jgi:hypothetical protein
VVNHIQPDVGPHKAVLYKKQSQHVQTCVKEREEAEWSPVLDEPVLAGEAAQRCDCQRGSQQAKRPPAGLQFKLVYRISNFKIPYPPGQAEEGK